MLSDPKIISNQMAADRALLQAQRMAENAVTNVDAAINALTENGLTDIDLHGLHNLRRSLAHLAKKITYEHTQLHAPVVTRTQKP